MPSYNFPKKVDEALLVINDYIQEQGTEMLRKRRSSMWSTWDPKAYHRRNLAIVMECLAYEMREIALKMNGANY
mgnify:CR=1 FL=1